jgi:hypothetical protein
VVATVQVTTTQPLSTGLSVPGPAITPTLTLTPEG